MAASGLCPSWTATTTVVGWYAPRRRKRSSPKRAACSEQPHSIELHVAPLPTMQVRHQHLACPVGSHTNNHGCRPTAIPTTAGRFPGSRALFVSGQESSVTFPELFSALHTVQSLPHPSSFAGQSGRLRSYSAVAGGPNIQTATFKSCEAYREERAGPCTSYKYALGEDDRRDGCPERQGLEKTSLS